MTIDLDIIKKYDSFFHEEDGKTITHPEFSQIEIDTKIAYQAGDSSLEPQLKFFNFIQSDLWNLKITSFKLYFLNNLRLSGKIDPILWYQMGSTDIEFFFTELRSIFDYVSLLISHISPRDIKQIKGNGESFRQLFQWLDKKPEVRDDFGSEYADIILECDWFWEIRRIRDAIRHKGSDTAVVSFGDTIQFQIFYPGYKPQITIPEIMPDGKIVNFEYCSVYYLAYLNDFLERLTDLIYSHTSVPKRIGVITETHTGNRLIWEWTRQFIAHLESM